jgi:hypothetical protein
LRLFQNPAGAKLRFGGQAPRKTGQIPVIPLIQESRFKTGVLEQPYCYTGKREFMQYRCINLQKLGKKILLMKIDTILKSDILKSPQ